MQSQSRKLQLFVIMKRQGRNSRTFLYQLQLMYMTSGSAVCIDLVGSEAYKN
jgi:hypothetical protein